MKKLTVLLTLVVVLFAFVGCATKSAAVVAPKVDTDNEWWNNPPADTSEYHYEVGYAKGSTLQISRNWAKADANASIAQYINNAVDAIVNTYVNDAGELASNNMQSLQAFEAVSQQKANATLTGVTYKFHECDDGSVYALAALPIGEFAESLKTKVQESFQRNAAAESAMNAMDAAIDKYFSK